MPADARGPARPTATLTERFTGGLAAPICLTWEWTYACNLSCTHCLSSSGRRDPAELTTAEMCSVIDELRSMQVFYVNVGGGEPTVRPDFWELLDYAVASSACQGGCMAAKFFTGLPLDGPDPECVRGHGADTLTAARQARPPQAGNDHSHRGRRSRVVTLGMPAVGIPAKPCDSSPVIS
jgi:hypothetical protein